MVLSKFPKLEVNKEYRISTQNLDDNSVVVHNAKFIKDDNKFVWFKNSDKNHIDSNITIDYEKIEDIIEHDGLLNINSYKDFIYTIQTNNNFLIHISQKK